MTWFQFFMIKHAIWLVGGSASNKGWMIAFSLLWLFLAIAAVAIGEPA